MAQITITITDTPENPAGTVEFDMACSPRFEPNLFDPKLTAAQALASAVLVILEQSCGIERQACINVSAMRTDA
jgi:hypothetical protein